MKRQTHDERGTHHTLPKTFSWQSYHLRHIIISIIFHPLHHILQLHSCISFSFFSKKLGFEFFFFFLWVLFFLFLTILGVETTRRFLLEWLSYLHRYIPVGLLEVVPQKLNWRPPLYKGRNDLETLFASDSASDWVSFVAFFYFCRNFGIKKEP